MKNKTTRLRFTDEELVDSTVKKSVERAEKAADRVDKAKAKLPTKSKLRMEEEEKSHRAEQLRFGKKDNSEAVKDPVTNRGKPKAKSSQKSGGISETNAPKLKSRLRFDDSAEEIIAPKSRAARTATHTVAGAVIGTVHKQIRQSEEDNVGVQAAHQSEEIAEGSAHVVDHAVYSRKLKAYNKAAKLEKKADKANVDALYSKYKADHPEISSNPISKWRQKQAIKKEYAAARAAGTAGRSASTAQTASTVGRKVDQATEALRHFFSGKSNGIKIILGFAVLMLVIVTLLQSCSAISTGVLSGITATSWPAEDSEITKAEAYYVKLEEELQKKIYDYESNHSDSDEFNYNVGEIGHDPAVLISYLSAKYGGFRFGEVKREIERLFNLQYQLETSTADEVKTITKTVRAGESLGQVVTSGYCNCTICCGQWSGGPTASGVYPRASHTIAVDANNPTVPMGTEIIMNGTLYKVEDTGAFARYGVDFDVYYDSHSAASAHGHQTWEAFYAGGDGQEIEVTTTENVTVSYVTLTSTDLESIVNSRMDEEEKKMYTVYQETRGNRVFFGMPVDCNWYHNIVGNYGYRYDYSSGRVKESEQMTLSVPERTEILSPINGTVTSISGDTIALEEEHGYQIKLIGCHNISVSEGAAVENGQKIAKVGSDASFSLEFIYKGTHLNPYFYFEVGTRELESFGEATGACAALIAEAKTHLGTPYVWGGYSPSGFDCSGFVSYCLTKSGALNTGHLTAAGLIDRCRIISKSELKPGDLVFFQGTYNTSPPSHVGIYVGSGVYGSNTFIHCGDPCKYGDLSSSYWIQHWYKAGRWY